MQSEEARERRQARQVASQKRGSRNKRCTIKSDQRKDHQRYPNPTSQEKNEREKANTGQMHQADSKRPHQTEVVHLSSTYARDKLQANTDEVWQKGHEVEQKHKAKMKGRRREGGNRDPYGCPHMQDTPKGSDEGPQHKSDQNQAERMQRRGALSKSVGSEVCQ